MPVKREVKGDPNPHLATEHLDDDEASEIDFPSPDYSYIRLSHKEMGLPGAASALPDWVKVPTTEDLAAANLGDDSNGLVSASMALIHQFIAEAAPKASVPTIVCVMDPFDVDVEAMKLRDKDGNANDAGPEVLHDVLNAWLIANGAEPVQTVDPTAPAPRDPMPALPAWLKKPTDLEFEKYGVVFDRSSVSANAIDLVLRCAGSAASGVVSKEDFFKSMTEPSTIESLAENVTTFDGNPSDEAAEKLAKVMIAFCRVNGLDTEINLEE